MAPTWIPEPSDFEPLAPAINLTLTYPEVRETTTAILLIFHGLGDSEVSFTTFARSVALPGVLALSVRGVSPLPPALLGMTDEEAAAEPARNFYWGDDITLSPETGELDPDPGFAKAEELILGRLIRDTLIGKCGWDTRDILLFGYGQGGSLALGLASRIRVGGERVTDVTEGGNGEDGEESKRFKGVVSIGGPLPNSMVPTISSREKSRTPAMICHGKSTEAVDEDAVEAVKKEFVDVRDVKWNKADDGMPASREEMLPIMQFFAERLSAEAL